jgi:hypothetical protein
MTGPLWLHAALASLMIVIAANCAIRPGLARYGVPGGGAQLSGRDSRPRWTSVDVDGLHVLMGVAMAGMLLPELRFLPEQVWEMVFGAGALWFGWRTVASRRTGARASGPRPSGSLLGGGAPLAQVIECLAMIFMLLPVVGDASWRSRSMGQGMAGMSQTALITLAPCVALLLALCLVGYVVWTTDALARTRVVTRSVAPAVATATGAGAGGAVGPAGAGVVGGLLAPRIAGFSTIAMALTMGYMLIQMA